MTAGGTPPSERKGKKKFGLFKKNSRNDTGSKKKSSKVEDSGSSVENVGAPSANPAEAAKPFLNGKEVSEMSEVEKKAMAAEYINSMEGVQVMDILAAEGVQVVDILAAKYRNLVGPHPYEVSAAAYSEVTSSPPEIQMRVPQAHEIVEEKNSKNAVSTATTWGGIIASATATAPQSESVGLVEHKPQRNHTVAVAWTGEELVMEKEETPLDNVKDPETLKQIAFLIAQERLLRIHADGLEISLKEERGHARRGFGLETSLLALLRSTREKDTVTLTQQGFLPKANPRIL